MLGLKEMKEFGRGGFTVKRLLLAGVAAAALFSYGGVGLSYLSTATRLVSNEVGDRIPVQFELERAKTMVDGLVPEIKRNMIVIAEEEVNVGSIRKEIGKAQAKLDAQEQEILKLRESLKADGAVVKIGNRPATAVEIKEDLARRFARYKREQETLEGKQALLISRENALVAARGKLDQMLNAKRDLEVEVENLQVQLRTVQSESIASRVDFDESKVAQCQKLVDSLHARLEVAERLIAVEGNMIEMPAAFTYGDQDVLTEIDAYFSKSASTSNLASNVR